MTQGKPTIRAKRTAGALVAMLVTGLLLAAGVLTGGSATAASLPQPPFKDANNGGPNDHGWFQGGLTWRGDFGDPDVIRIGSTYYAYSSPTGGRYLPVLTSTDLKNWTIHPQYSQSGPPGTPGYSVATDPAIPPEIKAYNDTDWNKYNNNDALVSPPSWGLVHQQGPWITRDYWAPSIVQLGSLYYAYSAVRVSNVSDDPNHYGRFCLTMATSTSPLGPFRDASGSAPIECMSASTDPGGSIDPYVYHSPNGHFYLLWKAAGQVGVRPSRLLAQQIGGDGRPQHGTPIITLLQTNSSQKWEGNTIEAPAMIDFSGATYLFYSANFSGVLNSAGASNYATGYAICLKGPLGPCTRPVPQSPLLASFLSMQGPGGATPFLDTAGHLHLAFSYYWLNEPPRSGGFHPRRMSIVGLVENGFGTLKVTS